MAQHVPDRFAGKTAIVTGAGSGIGRATAVRLVREGARVVATDLLGERLAELADEVGGDLVTIAGDVSAQDTVDEVVAAAGGTVDCLANNAGIMDKFLNAHEMDDDVWERVLSVNVTAVMRMTRAVIPGMLEAGRGSIVNTGSVASLSGMAGGTAYITSKHALAGFTRSCAVLYTPKGIRVNLVAPGAVKTNIEAPFASQFTAERLGPLMQAVVPPAAEPEQLAAAITWLLSDDSANVSGAILPSDGGWLAL